MNRPDVNYTIVSRKTRSTGFECPLNKSQVLITLDILTSSISCIYVVFMFNSKPTTVIFSIAFFITLALVIFYWVKSSAADPTDPVVVANKRALKESIPFDSARYENMCTVCNTSVGSNSKHCGACNRCVQDFDHHCIWLNNCIGYNNYRSFIKLIIGLLLNELIVFSVSVKHISIIGDTGVDTYGKDILGLLIYLLVQSCILIIFLLNLILLHIWLYKKGLTTYEFIKNRSLAKTDNKVSQDAANTKVNGPESSV